MRVYLPLTFTLLAQARERGRFGPAPLTAYAATAALQAEDLSVDEEEWEYHVLNAAAQGCIGLLTPADPALRLVAALDVAEYDEVPDSPGEVRLAHEVPRKRLGALLVDSSDAAETVAAAWLARPDEASADRCLDHELGWFGAQEIDALLGERAGRVTISEWMP